MPDDDVLDVLIVGGGVAGLACAFELIHENNRRFLLLDERDELGGQLKEIIFKIRDFGVYYVDGASLQKDMVALAKQIETPYRVQTRVVKCDLQNKTITTVEGTLRAKTIVLATGSRVRQLDDSITNGWKDKIFYWREGNESKLEGKRIAVVGAGDYALGEAVVLAQTNEKVLIVSRSAQLRARPDLINAVNQTKNIEVVFEKEISAIIGSQSLEAIEFKDSKTSKKLIEKVDAVLVKIGNQPNNELFKEQLKINQAGFVCVDKFMQTSCAGVFAIGDLNDGRWLRLATAQGDGVIAAHSALKFLNQEWGR